eukprot:1206679-Alexandrium_andersonii.AAC.1
MDLSPRTRRTIIQLGTTQQTHAKTWADLGTIPGLGPINVATAPRSASDLVTGPWGQEEASETSRAGARTSQQWA